VSGGGYIGSCLSSVLNDPTKEPERRKFPFHYELGVQEPTAYRQLRNGSNYLAPGGRSHTKGYPPERFDSPGR
jgi:hypothetical protein